MALIGFTGYAGVGKDTIANRLGSQYGYIVQGFADPLYKMADTLNPLLWRRCCFVPIPFRYKSAVSTLGLTKAKRIPSVRQYLQWLGTEVIRDCLSKDAFIDAAKKSINGDVIFTNCRFDNEAQMIKSQGGIIVRVTRPGYGPVNGHVSESGVSDKYIDLEVANDGKPEDVDISAIHDLAIEGNPIQVVSAESAYYSERLEAANHQVNTTTAILGVLLNKCGEVFIDDKDIMGLPQDSCISTEPVEGGVRISLINSPRA